MLFESSLHVSRERERRVLVVYVFRWGQVVLPGRGAAAPPYRFCAQARYFRAIGRGGSKDKISSKQTPDGLT